MYTYEYDSTEIPSMPVVAVEVAAYGKKDTLIALRAMVDSGSDGSMLPIKVLQQIKARKAAKLRCVQLQVYGTLLMFTKCRCD